MFVRIFLGILFAAHTKCLYERLQDVLCLKSPLSCCFQYAVVLFWAAHGFVEMWTNGVQKVYLCALLFIPLSIWWAIYLFADFLSTWDYLKFPTEQGTPWFCFNVLSSWDESIGRIVSVVKSYNCFMLSGVSHKSQRSCCTGACDHIFLDFCSAKIEDTCWCGAGRFFFWGLLVSCWWFVLCTSPPSSQTTYSWW